MHRATLAQTIGANFRHSRQQAGHTQETFGALIGWDRTRVAKAERGNHLAEPETVALWAGATSRDPFWFYAPHPEDEDDPVLRASA
jgi:transcriptional regulator with XRE-family HTH domain